MQLRVVHYTAQISNANKRVPVAEMLDLSRFIKMCRKLYNFCETLNCTTHKKIKASHTRYRALGPELIPVYTVQAVSAVKISNF